MDHNQRTIATVHVVSSLDASAQPPRERFQVAMRKGIQVNHVDNLRSAFRLASAEVVGLDDLEKLHARCQERLEGRERDAVRQKR